MIICDQAIKLGNYSSVTGARNLLLVDFSLNMRTGACTCVCKPLKISIIN